MRRGQEWPQSEEISPSIVSRFFPKTSSVYGEKFIAMLLMQFEKHQEKPFLSANLAIAL
jgi:hypothetical protein